MITDYYECLPFEENPGFSYHIKHFQKPWFVLTNDITWAIQVLRNAVGGGGACQLSRKKARYEGVRFNVISVTKCGGGGGQIPRKSVT